MLVGIARRFQQTHLETAEATPSTLRLLLHPRHLATPSLMVIIGIYNLFHIMCDQYDGYLFLAI